MSNSGRYGATFQRNNSTGDDDKSFNNTAAPAKRRSAAPNQFESEVKPPPRSGQATECAQSFQQDHSKDFARGYGGDEAQSQQSYPGDSGNSGNRPSDNGRSRSKNASQQLPPTSRSISMASGRGIRRRGSTWREANANGPPRRMEVSIPLANLRVFASAVQCLMKVGKELFIEATADQLILRTLNDAKSAFAAFYFNDSGGFFESFRCDASRLIEERSQEGSDTQGSAAGGGSVTCKVPIRAVYSIFRTLKKVVRLVVYVEGEDDEHIEPHLVFQMYCEYGYRKVHRFLIQDCEIMHAVFEGDGASRLMSPPLQLSQLLEHIHGTAEVAVGASHDILTVRSFHHPLTGSAERAVLKTEMSISTEEFDIYRFCGADDEEVELVFSLKEIKALLQFCETTEAQSLEMLFREGGDPLLFQSQSKTFAGELIMATMEPKIIRDQPGHRTGASAAAWKNSGQAGSPADGGGGTGPGSAQNDGQTDGRYSNEGAESQQQGEGGGGSDGHQEGYPDREPHEGKEGGHGAQTGHGEGKRDQRLNEDSQDEDERRHERQHSRDDGLESNAAYGTESEGSQSTSRPESAALIGDGRVGEGFVDRSLGPEGNRASDGQFDDDAETEHGHRPSKRQRSGRQNQQQQQEWPLDGSTDDEGPVRRGRSRERHIVDTDVSRGSAGTERGDDTDRQQADNDDRDQESEMPTQFPGLRAELNSVPPDRSYGDSEDESRGTVAIGDAAVSRKRRYVQDDDDDEDNSNLRL